MVRRKEDGALTFKNIPSYEGTLKAVWKRQMNTSRLRQAAMSRASRKPIVVMFLTALVYYYLRRHSFAFSDDRGNEAGLQLPRVDTTISETVSPNRGEDTPRRLRVDTMISELLPEFSALSAALFGETEAEVFSNIETPRDIRCLGEKLTLTQHRGDDSISRLELEFEGQDTYGITHISSGAPLVLDIGGNVGFISILTQMLHPKSQVVVFEPSPLTYFFLRLNLVLNNIRVLTSEELQGRPRVPGVYPVFGGVGARRAVEFATMSDSDRVKKQSQNGIVDYDRNGNVPVYNLNAFLSEHGLTQRVFDIVKLDCECCEYKVVPDSATWLLDRSKVLSLTGEIHGCGHLDRNPEIRTLEILRTRGCEFPVANFGEEGGRFRDTANLKDSCP
tara:strand:- start:727 stop:1896 length:1170 start_codon:yes stop_codon:yes gene_type:complete